MKRLLTLLLLGCLILGMVFAAGSSQPSVPASPSGPVEFTATFIKGSYHGDPNDMILYKQLDKETNVKVNWLVIPETNWNERKNILINSGDLPDVFYMNTYSNDEIDRYGRQGLFLDLTSYINQYAPNLVKVLPGDPIYKAAITNPSDGKIYSIRGMNSRLGSGLNGAMFIYQPWLDKLGIPFPKTYLEFENMLRAFKTKDPNGNGKADEFPFVFSNGSDNSSIQNLFSMFGYGYQGIRPSGDTFVDANGKAVFVPGTPNFRDAVIWLHKLFSEGLLAEEDYAAMDGNLFRAKLFSETVVAGSFQHFHKNSTYAPEDRYDDYVRVSIPLKGPNGHQIHARRSKVLGLYGGFIITNKAVSKVPAIMRWLDAHFDTRRSIEMSLGPIGITLEEKPGGIIGYKPTPPNTSYTMFRYGVCPSDNVPFYISPDAWGKTVEIMEEDLDRVPWIQGELKPFLTQTFIYRFPVVEETQFIQTKGKEIEDYVKTTQAKWLMQGGIEREWDAFQARLKTMGIDEYIKVMQNQLDRFAQYSK